MVKRTRKTQKVISILLTSIMIILALPSYSVKGAEPTPYIYVFLEGYFEYWKGSDGVYRYQDYDGDIYELGDTDPDFAQVVIRYTPIQIPVTHQLTRLYDYKYQWNKSDSHITQWENDDLLDTINNHYAYESYVRRPNDYYGETGVTVEPVVELRVRGTDTAEKVANNVFRTYTCFVAEFTDNDFVVDPEQWMIDHGVILPPPDPGGPPPTEGEPDIELWFEKRTTVPDIPVNRVYEGEDILIMSDIYGGYNWRWDVRSRTGGTVNYSGDGLISGLYGTNEPDSKVEARQRASYDDFVWSETTDDEGNVTGEWKQVRRTADKTRNFSVEPIQPPVIEFETDMNIGGFNLTRVGETLNIKTHMYDINEPSQQHPYGFSLGKKWAFIKKSDGEIALEGTGEFDNESFLVTREHFRPDETYIFRAEAWNTFNNEKRTVNEFEFYVENRHPELELSVELPDDDRALFATEPFKLVIDAYDADGYIMDADIEIENDDEGNLIELSRQTVSGLGNIEYKERIEYKSDTALSPVFKVTVYDDCGADTTVDLLQNIVEPTIVSVISIENEAEILKKENRYMRYDALKTYTNAPFGIDQTKFEWMYRFDDNAWTTVSNAQDYYDNDIHIYFPYYPHTSVIQMYPRRSGDLSFLLKATDSKGFESEQTIKTDYIAEDLPPELDYNIETTQHRITEYDIEDANRSEAITEDNIRKGYIKISDQSRSEDGDRLNYKEIYIVYDGLMQGGPSHTEYITAIKQSETGHETGSEILVDATGNRTIYVQDINNVNLTYITDVDALGDYYVRVKAKELNTQLPPTDSPLYQEIADTGLSCVSEYSKVFLDNIRPDITFEVGEERKINLIIHFDGNIDMATNDKINQLVNQLEGKGFKVNIIKHENRY